MDRTNSERQKAKERALSLISQGLDVFSSLHIPIVQEPDYTQTLSEIKAELAKLSPQMSPQKCGFEINHTIYKNCPSCRFLKDGVSLQGRIIRHIHEVANLLEKKDFPKTFMQMDKLCTQEPWGWFQDSMD